MAFHIVTPSQAEAATALFRVKQFWSGVANNGATFWTTAYASPSYHPRVVGPDREPAALGQVTHTTYSNNGFTIPSRVIRSYGSQICFPFGCYSPISASSVMNSYWNAKASFGPDNGPSSPETIRFGTTMGNPWPPPWTGSPVTPTTRFAGNYDFSRSGSIRINPGPNRFGGTLRMLTGANQLVSKSIMGAGFYQRQYGAGTRPFADLYQLPIPTAYRYRMTEYGYNRETTGTANSPGDYYVQKVMYIPEIITSDFTTGMVSVVQSGLGASSSGYDNRTTLGWFGSISMVRPRLVHRYVVPHDPALPIRKERTFARIDRMRVLFVEVGDYDADGVWDLVDNCSEVPNPSQDDSDADACGNLCDADYTQTGTVAFGDFGEFTRAFGTTQQVFNHTEPVTDTVGFGDFGFFIANFGTSPGPSGATEGTTACP